MIVIEFLYGEYSDTIKAWLMPPFIVHMLSILATIGLTNFYRSHYDLSLSEEGDATVEHDSELEPSGETLKVINRAKNAPYATTHRS